MWQMSLKCDTLLACTVLVNRGLTTLVAGIGKLWWPTKINPNIIYSRNWPLNLRIDSLEPPYRRIATPPTKYPVLTALLTDSFNYCPVYWTPYQTTVPSTDWQFRPLKYRPSCLLPSYRLTVPSIDSYIYWNTTHPVYDRPIVRQFRPLKCRPPCSRPPYRLTVLTAALASLAPSVVADRKQSAAVTPSVSCFRQRCTKSRVSWGEHSDSVKNFYYFFGRIKKNRGKSSSC